jgi:arylsulfatase A-like enzyme
MGDHALRVICFDIDCLRPDHLGCYGYARPTSPAIDGVAAGGVRFERYYCASSPCLPSRAAWVTGRYGIHTGVISNHGEGARFRFEQRSRRTGQHFDSPIAREPDMLPRHLRAHGWETATLSNFADRHAANWFLYGWSETHSVNLKGGRETAPEVTDRALRWLRANAGRDRWFLHVNFWDAHRAYKMDPAWAERFRGHPVPLAWPDEATIRDHGKLQGRLTPLGQWPGHVSPFPLMPGAIRSRRDFERLVTGYDTAIAYVDHHIGLILRELEGQGGLDDTAVIVTADHGDPFGERGLYGDHLTADECVQRIPLVIRWPGLPAGRSDRALLSNVDFYPTLCDLMGLPAPALVDGRSFAAHARGTPGPGRDCLVWDTACYAAQRAVRTPELLMLRTYDPFGCPARPLELYEIEKDPCQTRDLAAARPDLVARCDALLAQWLREQREKPYAVDDPMARVMQERGLEWKPEECACPERP